MASKQITIVAVLYPKKGKADQVVALLKEHGEYVKANEPNTLRYEINKSVRPAQDGTEEIIMVEKYKDSKSLKAHGTDSRFTEFQKKLVEQGLVLKPALINALSEQGGFSSRL